MSAELRPARVEAIVAELADGRRVVVIARDLTDVRDYLAQLAATLNGLDVEHRARFAKRRESITLPNGGAVRFVTGRSLDRLRGLTCAVAYAEIALADRDLAEIMPVLQSSGGRLVRVWES